MGGFGFFEFALVGIPLLAGTIAIVVLFGERLLPTRKPRAIKRDFGDLARTLVDQYALDDDPTRSSAGSRAWRRWSSRRGPC